MKKLFILIASLTIALAPMSAQVNNNQVKTEQTEQTCKPAKQVKQGEPTNLVYPTKDGKRLPVYRGAKGGLFVIRTSAKTGNQYRQYVKEDKCETAK